MIDAMIVEIFWLKLAAFLVGISISAWIAYVVLRRYLPQYTLQTKLAKIALQKDGVPRQVRLRTYQSLFASKAGHASKFFHLDRTGSKTIIPPSSEARVQTTNASFDDWGTETHIRYLSEILKARSEQQYFFRSALFLKGIEALFKAYSHQHLLEQMMKLMAVEEKTDRALLYLKEHDKENGTYLKLKSAWVLKLWDKQHSTTDKAKLASSSAKYSHQHLNISAAHPAEKPANETEALQLRSFDKETLAEMQATTPQLFAKTEVYFKHLEPFVTYEKKGIRYQITLHIPLFKSDLPLQRSLQLDKASATKITTSKEHVKGRATHTPSILPSAPSENDATHPKKTEEDQFIHKAYAKQVHNDQSQNLEGLASILHNSDTTSNEYPRLNNESRDQEPPLNKHLLGCIKLEKDMPFALENDIEGKGSNLHNQFFIGALRYAQFTWFLTKCHQCFTHFSGRRSHDDLNTQKSSENNDTGFLTEVYMEELLKNIFHTYTETGHPHFLLGIVNFSFAAQYKQKVRSVLKTFMAYLEKELPADVNFILGLSQGPRRLIYVLAITEQAIDYLNQLFALLLKRFLDPLFPGKEVTTTFNITVISPATFTSLKASAENVLSENARSNR
ncbi:hypothetical protein COTS27_01681 [Spirochaetota bacterium]|nr:hypothetical protein COTS27_01681 [Spirochaetota bacterium]